MEIYAEMQKEKEDNRIKAEKEREEMLKKQPEPVPAGMPNQVMQRVNQSR